MTFGTEIGVVVVRGSAPANRIAKLGSELFCDGMTSPNPGFGLPIVYDGTTFLNPVFVLKNGNHSTVYHAVDQALDHALASGVTHLTITLFSKLVWGQIARQHGVDLLKDRRDAVLTACERFQEVRWRLARPPMTVNGRKVAGRGLRRAAMGNALVSGTSYPAVWSRPPAPVVANAAVSSAP